MYCPSCDQLGYPMGTFTSCSHCWRTRSNNIKVPESFVSAAMYLPSGDQRGEKNCFAPGRGEIFPVTESRITMPGPVGILLGEPASFKVNTIDLPSADHPGSYPASAPGISSRSPGPSLEIRYARHPVFKVVPMNTIRFPSGDHRGNAAVIGSNVS